MSIVSSQINMPASNLLHPLVHSDAPLNRKRYLEDLEALDHQQDSKRSRTAPPSPPTVSAAPFRRRSASPTPPSSAVHSLRTPPPVKSTIITPESPLLQLAEPVHIERAQPVLSVPTTTEAPAAAAAAAATTTHLPPVSSLTQDKPVEAGGLKLPSLKYLTKNDRFGGISHYSLDYPDTCVNDDDWRLNLEFWIEKNFPEKFNNLKNLLRYDKPGFELLNDAIFLTELKEKLDNEQRSAKPTFNSRISTKMVQKRENPYYYQRRASQSDDESHLTSPYARQQPVQPQLQQQHHYHHQHTTTHTSSSPIASTSHLHTQPYSYDNTSNYTYSSQVSPTSPTSAKLPSVHTQSPQHKSTSSHTQSSPTSASRPQWNGHHKLDQQPVVLNSNSFIHTQTHKGPNHTYTIHHHNAYKRVCISCGTDQSPCWRPSWSVSAGQLCNSCGLRYKKTGARCVEKNCTRIPAKGEWMAMESRGKVEIEKADGSKVIAYKCLHCGGEVEVKERGSSSKKH